MKKLALIGCGLMGESHLDNLMKLRGFEFAGFCDLIPERAERFAKKCGSGKTFTDFRKMYDEVKPDMVYLCVPPYEHGGIEFESIDRGIHMFIEKPVSLDLGVARKIRDRIVKNNIISAVGFQCRYDNINDDAREYISKNEIAIAQGSRIGGIPEAVWWNKKALSGGQLVEQSIHQIDIARYLLGEADRVYSVGRRGIVKSGESPGYDTDDVSTSVITFKSGVSFTFITGCYSKNGASWNSQLAFGSRSSRLEYTLLSNVTIYGLIEEDVAGETAGVIQGDGTQRKSAEEIGIKIESNVDVGVVCDETFVNAVITGDGSKIRSPYADALKTVAITLACNESMETGAPVSVAAD